MPFPNIDPVAFSIGPLDIRWYGLAYFFGLALGVWYGDKLVARYRDFGLPNRVFDSFAPWAVAGVLIGGRLGSILLYNPDYYFANPLKIFALHEGGMAFHGGLLGVTAAAWIFCRKEQLRFLAFADVMSCVAPIGLLLGRVANFINGELWGRPSSLPWAVVFPNPAAGALPRHPSQLYEAALEGLVLLLLLNTLASRATVRTRHGLLAACFLIGYALFRSVIEFTREPDASLIGPLTRGQAYSLPMLLAGAVLIVFLARRQQRDLQAL